MRANEILKEQVPKDAESFEVADGRITWVNQNGTVWINVGSADAIRRQVTFNVYDADENDADRAVKKGSIEVTRVMGDHSAEARITQDSPTNPILTGDNIYSPVWHRGKKLRFAFAGVIDFDDDGVSDLKLARELIELNGGVVDAYLDDNGKIVKDITPNTRYLRSRRTPVESAHPGWHARRLRKAIQESCRARRRNDHARPIPQPHGLHATGPNGSIGSQGAAAG